MLQLEVLWDNNIDSIMSVSCSIWGICHIPYMAELSLFVCAFYMLFHSFPPTGEQLEAELKGWQGLAITRLW